MFLPVLLVRDFGLWGFLVFAAPNVIGAAAMGWILRSGASQRIVQTHAPVIGLFSLVTASFQLFFVVSMAMKLVGTPKAAAGLALLSLGALAGGALAAGKRAGAALLWLGSLALLALSAHSGGLNFSGPPNLDLSIPDSASMSSSLLWLAPVCIFGFALCPYLDGTFHKARQACDERSARWAFGLGFGLFFLVMIIGTLGYRAIMASAMTSPGQSTSQALTIALGLVIAHIAAQATYTLVLHVKDGPPLQAIYDRPIDRTYARIGYSLLGAILACAAAIIGGMSWSYANLTSFEIVYRSFMAFYGLVFPAYVWLCMIPTHAKAGSHAGLSGSIGHRKLVIWLVSVIVAAPFFWLGFMDRQSIWLAPGLGCVLLARLLVRRLGR